VPHATDITATIIPNPHIRVFGSGGSAVFGVHGLPLDQFIALEFFQYRRAKPDEFQRAAKLHQALHRFGLRAVLLEGSKK
jgi:hypothetical protein